MEEYCKRVVIIVHQYIILQIQNFYYQYRFLVSKEFATEIALCVGSIFTIAYVALLEIRIYKLTEYNSITFDESK